jgi:FkbM family methyltransferase
MDFLHRFAQAPKPRWLRLILRRLVLLILPETIEFHGYRLVLNQEDHVMGSALLRGRYEPLGTKLFLERLALGMTVVDCGANIGIYTCLASGAVGATGKVFAFEPEPSNFDCLIRTIELNRLSNVQAERAALSDCDGEARLFLSDINMGDHRIGAVDETRTSVAVVTRSLDSYWADASPQVDLLKMDVQGAEGLILKGMAKTILRSPKLKIVMEFWPYGLIRCGTNPRDLLDDLAGYGFTMRVIDQEHGTLRPVKNVAELLASEKEETSFDLFLER